MYAENAIKAIMKATVRQLAAESVASAGGYAAAENCQKLLSWRLQPESYGGRYGEKVAAENERHCSVAHGVLFRKRWPGLAIGGRNRRTNIGSR